MIFKAKINRLDNKYQQAVTQLRARALQEFNCTKFESIGDSKHEIALSYWNNLNDIQAWHSDTEHKIAQQLGKEQWYKSFSVEICEVIRNY